ncbi:MAG: GIY-YIG nuclease family protein [Sphingobacteriaceae bacterium]|nr:GIY-YIG nuclease family protein [Sphingobacteriaceae bacterium]
MFAIIDIETCGSKFEFQRGRITEICILKHDGLQVIDKFTTLINPECYISPYFTKLTNITNEMVADAPRFHEVAKKIVEMTEGCVFVAHNVGFDYSFIKSEFESLGYQYRRETLCTVRLSRKLIPGKISYSLGHLCAALGIEIFDRHRAEGDAVATGQLFDLLLRLKADHPQYKNKGVTEIMTRRIDNIKSYILKKLPETCGVYYFLNKEQQIIYIGKSLNMYQRAQSHFNSKEKKGKQMLNDLYNVDFVLTGSELIALLLESEEIKKHKPKYNRARKSDDFSHGIEYFYDEKGILNFRISETEEVEQVLMNFVSYSSAREKLDRMIEEYTLCLRYCGLTGAEAVCFNHQIKSCNGICAEQESAEDYNDRAKKIIEANAYHQNNFVLIDRGRVPEERSLILIENGKYKGYGYFDQSHQLSSPEDFMQVAESKKYYPDCDVLVKGWMRNNKKYKLLNIE